MRGGADETVGPGFSSERLELARDKTLAVIERAAALARPGWSEREARKQVQQIQLDLGAEKAWHPPQIRFGKNTLLPFGARGDDDVVLGERDLFFLILDRFLTITKATSGARIRSAAIPRWSAAARTSKRSGARRNPFGKPKTPPGPRFMNSRLAALASAAGRSRSKKRTATASRIFRTRRAGEAQSKAGPNAQRRIAGSSRSRSDIRRAPSGPFTKTFSNKRYLWSPSFLNAA